MINNFSFNPNTYNLWEVYEAIKKYYPIGIMQSDEGTGLFYEYPNLKKLEERIVDNIHNQKNYQNRWGTFTASLALDMDKKEVGTTHGQAPSFSSSIILESKTIENFTHQKELHFAVSLVGAFYQIYGLDTVKVSIAEEKKVYATVNMITTSPLPEWESAFGFVEKRIQEKFTDYRIIPFAFGQQKIVGLQVRYSNEKECTIREALFNSFLREDTISRNIRGNRLYGKEQWLIEK